MELELKMCVVKNNLKATYFFHISQPRLGLEGLMSMPLRMESYESVGREGQR